MLSDLPQTKGNIAGSSFYMYVCICSHWTPPKSMQRQMAEHVCVCVFGFPLHFFPFFSIFLISLALALPLGACAENNERASTFCGHVFFSIMRSFPHSFIHSMNGGPRPATAVAYFWDLQQIPHRIQPSGSHLLLGLCVACPGTAGDRKFKCNSDLFFKF